MSFIKPMATVALTLLTLATSLRAADAIFTLDGAFAPKAATMQLITPGSETAKNSIAKPDTIKVTAAEVTLNAKTIKATLPPLSAAVIKITR